MRIIAVLALAIAPILSAVAPASARSSAAIAAHAPRPLACYPWSGCRK